MPRSRADIEIIRAYQDRDEIARKLKITVAIDGLMVDADEVMISRHDIRWWRLVPANDGQWLHPDSDTRGPLYDHLCTIAGLFVFDVNNPRHVAALKDRGLEWDREEGRPVLPADPTTHAMFQGGVKS